MPGPRISRPVCCTSTSRGGSHLVMIMVSRTPTCRPPGSGSPVRAASRPCSRCAGPSTVRTSVASIHSPWLSQSVSTAQARSGDASTSTRSVSSGTGLLLLYVGGRRVGGHPLVVRPFVLRGGRGLRTVGEARSKRRDLGVPLLEHERELVEQPVDLAHPVPAEDRRDPQRADVVGGHGAVVG